MTIATGEQALAADVANGANLPSGVILMWSGLVSNIPSGFVICDGNNGTPNLLARFIEGVATAATNPGTTGGATSKTTDGHTTPSHTLTISEIPAHTHDIEGMHNVVGATNNVAAATTVGSYSKATSSVGGSSGHTHGSTTDTISDIRPLYYDIAFIMKT